MNKVFLKELKLIDNERIRESISILLDNLPDYFYHIPASSTGKYHPKSSLGEGGLVRHTKIAFYYAKEILGNPLYGKDFSNIEKDLMKGAILLHDGIKKGFKEEEYTLFDHPLLATQFIKENASKTSLREKEVLFLVHVIESHMGIWNTNRDLSIELPIPKDKYQKFVHLCDFLASRKEINLEFDKDNNII